MGNQGAFVVRWPYFDGLVQEGRNSSALAMELRLSCTNPSIWDTVHRYDMLIFAKILTDTLYFTHKREIWDVFGLFKVWNNTEILKLFLVSMKYEIDISLAEIVALLAMIQWHMHGHHWPLSRRKLTRD